MVIKIRKSKKDRQHNGQKKKDKGKDNDLQNTTITVGLFRKYSRLWQHKCESQIRLLKILYTLVGAPLNFEGLGFSLSSQ